MLQNLELIVIGGNQFTGAVQVADSMLQPGFGGFKIRPGGSHVVPDLAHVGAYTAHFAGDGAELLLGLLFLHAQP